MPPSKSKSAAEAAETNLPIPAESAETAVTAPGDNAKVTATPPSSELAPPAPAAAADLPAVGAEEQPTLEPEPVVLLVRCCRPQGIWRAGRFWPSERKKVRAADLTEEEFERLVGEPLLSIEYIQE